MFKTTEEAKEILKVLKINELRFLAKRAGNLDVLSLFLKSSLEEIALLLNIEKEFSKYLERFEELFITDEEKELSKLTDEFHYFVLEKICFP